MKGYLLLEDRTIYEGSCFGALEPTCGELVFNTSMTGYQEILTDPSYWRQNVVLTFPEIGVYGTNNKSTESLNGHASGMIVRHLTPCPDHRLSTADFDGFLKERGIPLISGIDTRTLTVKIRESGPQKSIIAPHTLPKEEAARILAQHPSMEGANLAPEVSCSQAAVHGDGKWNIGLIDYGVKNSIIKELVKRDCTVTQLPWNTSFEQIQAFDFDGFMLSNGPGDPAAVPGVRETILQCQQHRPTMAICLGYQLLALALGAETYKLPFGHRGGNHPVKDVRTNRVFITSHNHGFAVRPETFKEKQVELTHTSLFDGSLEGYRLKDRPVFGVQFHPEAGPGPSDAHTLFDQFITMLEDTHAKR
ncbi:MAG: carbamoyl phosphate synthase small subunit [Acidobacteria bacterium]|nr:MAG: carbamoyl phosphate synthase small subunit [Acidobacteriota bacterium]PIE89699.1 MAG: carbamoyl phosphate synthase small subunit [Acidobacteriota bacterium]